MKTFTTRKLLILLCLMLTASGSYAATIRAVNSGYWESTSTWQNGTLPANGDSIIIPNGKIVEVTTMPDYNGGAAMKINIFGELTFQTGKKLTLPPGSEIIIQVAAYISPGNGGGNSNIINVGTQVVWTAGQGTITGYLVLPSTPLPVQMISFKANSINDKQIFLAWATAAEVNNDYFNIEKSSDGRNFIKIGQVDGHGSSSVGFDYEFTDTAPHEGMNYYRLMQVDFDGEFEYTQTISCDLKPGVKNSVRIFPNPTKGEINLWINSESGDLSFEYQVTDARGNKILENTIELIPASKTINITKGISELKPGIYYLTIIVDDEPVRKQLMIK